MDANRGGPGSLGNSTPSPPQMDFAEPYYSLLRTGYVFLTMFNVLGNGLMSYVLLVRRNLHTAQNYLLLNLSLADVIGALGIYPYVFIDVHPRLSSEVGQAIICAIVRGQVFYFISVGTSLANLCVISWNRYFAIRFPLRTKFQLSRRAAVKLVLAIWLAIFVLSLPFWAYYKYSLVEQVCIGKADSLGYRIYGTFVLVFALLLPVSFLVLSLVALQLVARARTSGVHEASLRLRANRLERAETVVRLLIVNLFASWCPFLVYWFVKSFTSYFPSADAGQLERRRWARVTLLFSTVNGTLDPLLFYVGSSKIRQETCALFRQCWKGIKLRDSNFSPSDDSDNTRTFRITRLSSQEPQPVQKKPKQQHNNLSLSESAYSNRAFSVIPEDQ